MNAVFQSDCGKIRPINEDYCYVKQYGEDFLCIIADGMGGHKSGEIASALAAKSVTETFDKNAEHLKEEQAIIACLKASVLFANEQVFEKSMENPDYTGMGTTLIVLYATGATAYLANVGDSRAYYVQVGDIRQITADHSVVGDLVRKGTITPKQARVHPQKNIITKAVGTEKRIDPDYFRMEIEPGDIIVLCTDGLTNMVEDYEIAEIVLQDIPLLKRAQALIDLANEKDGYDNISVVLLG